MVATNFSVSSRLSLPDPCLSFTILSMRTDSQDKRDKNYPARIPFVFKGDSIQIQIVMVRPCESHLVIFNLIYLIKPMPSFFDNPDPFLLFIVHMSSVVVNLVSSAGLGRYARSLFHLNYRSINDNTDRQTLHWQTVVIILTWKIVQNQINVSS